MIQTSETKDKEDSQSGTLEFNGCLDVKFSVFTGLCSTSATSLCTSPWLLLVLTTLILMRLRKDRLI
jgi:hypothetical protein